MNIFDEEIDEKYNVYSFGFSGAPLSQYLKWAEYSINVFNSKHLVFNIVENDFDESHLNIKNQIGLIFCKNCGVNFCNV